MASDDSAPTVQVVASESTIAENGGVSKVSFTIGGASESGSKMDLDDALKMIKKYIDSPSNALIHELAGDIFFKKKEFDNAKQQYIIAKEEYSNETSKLIIDMKIAKTTD